MVINGCKKTRECERFVMLSDHHLLRRLPQGVNGLQNLEYFLLFSFCLALQSFQRVFTFFYLRCVLVRVYLFWLFNTPKRLIDLLRISLKVFG